MTDTPQATPQITPTTLTVMVVEDDWYAQQAISLLLRADDIELIGVCATPEDALTLAEQRQPAVALIDMRLQGDQRAGVELIRELRVVSPETICGVITATDMQGDLYADAFNAGAHGYTRKGDARNSDLRELTRRLAKGEWVVDSEISARYVNRGVRAYQFPARAPGGREPQLTERELETLALVAQQLSTKEIAERMVISDNTVKTHIAHIIDKLHVQNRDQAVLYAVLKGYLNPSR
ncbi:MAG TPA: response regulator transcription factor [Ktedonobacterales bacterium]|jgi:DNA-binding NarL/FixJ family response regulator|nr:response regulator transcription factor [Ktedonobacterales bacterium]